ncbi:hypothetical protein WJX84_006042 [Apatococcus fuscideae]|uniref:Uncharacterized protein n=1 Tax=Apatococcus fuscideae TaxID=2026836 RepID=A0AAW1THY0_9CHLO
MTQRIWVVTGASRGLGAEFVRQLLLDGANYVIATMRTLPTEETAPLKCLKSRYQSEKDDRLHLLLMNVTSQSSIEAAVAEIEKVKPEGIDYIINNAGVSGDWVPALDTATENYTNVLEVNVMGPFLVTKAFLPQLAKRQTRTVINLSSFMGSCKLIASLDSSNWFATGLLPYHCSKSALNMQTVVLANQLRSESFILIAINPGFVATDMGKEAVAVSKIATTERLDESVGGMLKVIQGLTTEDTGRFYDLIGDLRWQQGRSCRHFSLACLTRAERVWVVTGASRSTCTKSVTGDWVPALETTSADFDSVLNANVVGTFLVTQALLPLLQKKYREPGWQACIGCLNNCACQPTQQQKLDAHHDASRLCRYRYRIQRCVVGMHVTTSTRIFLETVRPWIKLQLLYKQCMLCTCECTLLASLGSSHEHLTNASYSAAVA